jgi:hypothetical protein
LQQQDISISRLIITAFNLIIAFADAFYLIIAFVEAVHTVATMLVTLQQPHALLYIAVQETWTQPSPELR